MKWLAARLSRTAPSGEGGFAMIEAIVSAALLLIVAAAVVTGINGASASTGREKARSIASTLAEQEQERLRALSFTDLVSYSTGPQTQSVDGVDYSVASTTGWIRDDTAATPTCANDSTQGDYLRISSTVTSAIVGGAAVAPVTITSLVAPPVSFSSTRGTLAVQVADRAGAPVANKSVSISGPSSATTMTDAGGCAMFQYIPIGSYSASLGTVGYVDHFGVNGPTASQTVAAGSMSTIQFSYDVAAGFNATIKSYQPGSTTSLVASKASALTVLNSSEPSFTQTFAASPESATVTGSGLFPFTNAYTAFTGSCGYQDPSTYAASYYTANAGIAQPVLTPGGTTAVTVLQPPLYVKLLRNASGALTSASAAMTVRATPVGSGCTAPAITLSTLTGSNAGVVGRSGSNIDAGVPFGRYSLCVQDRDEYSVLLDGTTTAKSYDATKLATTLESFSPGAGGRNPVWTAGTCP